MEPILQTSMRIKRKGKQWVSWFIDRNTAVYCDFFAIVYILPDVLNKIKNKPIINNIFRIQDDESIMCGFYCLAFIQYMFVEKTLLDYTILTLFRIDVGVGLPVFPCNF